MKIILTKQFAINLRDITKPAKQYYAATNLRLF